MNGLSAITTTGTATFGACNTQAQRLFRLNAGIDAEQALEHASLLMASANQLTLLSSQSPNDGTMAWAAHYLGDMAKAIIDDVTAGLQRVQVTPAVAKSGLDTE